MSEQTFVKPRTISILVLTLVLGLTACGEKESKKPASQVAAKVNAEEISVHQINYVLSHTAALANVPAEKAPVVRREVLNKLIDQQLAVEQAIEQKLDRSPEVLMAVEAARRDVLARAYIEQVASKQPKPSDEDAKKYYAENPALFAERRIYNIQEIVLPATEAVMPQLRAMVDSGKSMEDIATWLKNQNVKFGGAGATRTAEQIPLELLSKVHQLKDGQGAILQNGTTITIMRIVSSQTSPIAESDALPRIQMFLTNKSGTAAAERELKELKAKAKIAYQGEFADVANVPPVPAAPSATEPPTISGADTVIEKGAASLK